MQVILSSSAHKRGNVQLDDLDFKKSGYDEWKLRTGSPRHPTSGPLWRLSGATALRVSRASVMYQPDGSIPTHD